MNFKNALLSILILCSLLHAAETQETKVQLFHLRTQTIFNPKTGRVIPGYQRLEFHRCQTQTISQQSTFRGFEPAGVPKDSKRSVFGYRIEESTSTIPSARVTIVKRPDGSIVEEASTIDPYPDPIIGEFLDVFHSKVPKQTQDNVRIILNYMATVRGSDDEALAKLAAINLLLSEFPKGSKTLISLEKQYQAALDLYEILKSDPSPKYQEKAFLAKKKSQGVDEILELLYKGCGSVQCANEEEYKSAVALGGAVVRHITIPLQAAIQAAKYEEMQKAAEAKPSHTLK